jgi:hypothetical protein
MQEERFKMTLLNENINDFHWAVKNYSSYDQERVRFPIVSLKLVLGSTQPLTEMSTRNILLGVKAAGA